MIDLHSHILANIDDGARTWEESLDMARRAAADGTRVLAATPHSPDSTASRSYDPAWIREQVAALNSVLQSEQTPIQIVVGTEITYASNIVERLRNGALLPYGESKAILVELVGTYIPPTFETALFNLQVAGYTVVLAHPERIPEVQDDPNRLVPLIERGVLMQITAMALTGGQGERRQAIAETLLTHGMAHVIASDSHSARNVRPPLLAEARRHAASLVGEEAARRLVEDTPRALLAGTRLKLASPRRTTHRSPRRHG